MQQKEDHEKVNSKLFSFLLKWEHFNVILSNTLEKVMENIYVQCAADFISFVVLSGYKILWEGRHK